MMQTKSPRLEVITRQPSGTPRPRPLIFVHGAYVGAWSWDRHYLPYFADRGWQATAFSLSGHAGSAGAEGLNAFSIQDYVSDLREIVTSLDRDPVVIGHSMGGLIVQKYLEQWDLPGLVLVCSVPPQGLLGSALHMMFTRPMVLLDLHRVIGGGVPSPESLSEALFHQPVSRAMLNECYMNMQAESMRAIWDMSGFDLPRRSQARHLPTLVIGAEHDALIPPVLVEQTAQLLDCPASIIPNMGHAMMLEADWQPGAQCIADWLLQHDF